MGNDWENQIVSKKDVITILDRISVSYSLLKDFEDCGAFAALKSAIEDMPSGGEFGKESGFVTAI